MPKSKDRDEQRAADTSSLQGPAALEIMEAHDTLEHEPFLLEMDNARVLDPSQVLARDGATITSFGKGVHSPQEVTAGSAVRTDDGDSELAPESDGLEDAVFVPESELADSPDEWKTTTRAHRRQQKAGRARHADSTSLEGQDRGHDGSFTFARSMTQDTSCVQPESGLTVQKAHAATCAGSECAEPSPGREESSGQGDFAATQDEGAWNDDEAVLQDKDVRCARHVRWIMGIVVCLALACLLGQGVMSFLKSDLVQRQNMVFIEPVAQALPAKDAVSPFADAQGVLSAPVPAPEDEDSEAMAHGGEGDIVPDAQTASAPATGADRALPAAQRAADGGNAVSAAVSAAAGAEAVPVPAQAAPPASPVPSVPQVSADKALQAASAAMERRLDTLEKRMDSLAATISRMAGSPQQDDAARRAAATRSQESASASHTQKRVQTSRARTPAQDATGTKQNSLSKPGSRPPVSSKESAAALRGWSVLGLGASRAVLKDPSGQIWDMGPGERSQDFVLRRVDQAQGRVHTSAGVLVYKK